MFAVHCRGEANHLGPVLPAIAGDQIVEPGDHLLEQAAAAIEAIDACVDQQAVIDQLREEALRLGRVLADRIPPAPPRPEASTDATAGDVVLAYVTEQAETIRADSPRQTASRPASVT